VGIFHREWICVVELAVPAAPFQMSGARRQISITATLQSFAPAA
jgi:hypothetical protein